MKQKKLNVLKKTLQQKFDQCDEATLVVGQRDLVEGRFLFIALNVKTITVKCYATGKKIHKRYWNEQTKAEADELSNQFKVSRTGWNIMYSFIAVGIIVLFSILYYVMETKKQHLESYMGKTEEEQKDIRKKLNSGDLLMTTTGVVYIIESLNDTIMKVTKSNIYVPTSDLSKPINENVYSKSSFDTNTIIEINKTSFVKSGMINKNLNSKHGGAVVYQILDR
ncbi:MAG TPA: hypothetical protein DDZ39_03565 [Flavobacteriaceae bacterium]|jgi:preprotein translocase subunit YajC|nr:hypothetical protein [Flavobacteriaceae bacterium]